MRHLSSAVTLIVLCLFLFAGAVSCLADDNEPAHILFDETRLPFNTEEEYYHCAIEESGDTGTSKFAQRLRAQGYTVEAGTVRPITPEVLANTDVLVILEPQGDYLLSEVKAIQSFVHQGGGLFLSCGNWRQSEFTRGTDNIARAFGLSFKDNGLVRDSSGNYGQDLSVLKSHILFPYCILDNVSLYLSRGTYLDELGGASVIAQTSENSWFDSVTSTSWGDNLQNPDEKSGPFPVLVAMGYGSGRIVLAGDTLFVLNNAIDRFDDEQLASNIVQWLASDWVDATNQPPVAHFMWGVVERDEITVPGLLIQFDASTSNDPDGDIVAYAWDWDSDGDFDEYSETAFAEHQFAQSSMYTVTLRVVDDKGTPDQVTLTEREAAQFLWRVGWEAYDTESGSWKKEDVELAIAAYQNVIALQPEFLDAYQNLVSVLDAAGRTEDAISILHKLLSLTDDPRYSVPALTSLGIGYHKTCALEEAKQSLRRALHINPDHTLAHRVLASVYTRLGEYDLARMEYQQVLEQEGPDDDVMLWMATLYIWEGDYDAASKHLLSILEENPEFTSAIASLASIFILQEKLEEALPLFEQILDSTEDQSLLFNVHMQLTWCFVYTEEWERAAEELHLAQAQAPETLTPISELDLYTAIGRVYQALGDGEGARQAFLRAVSKAQEALVYSPVDRFLDANLVFCYGYLNRWDEAASFYRKAISLSYGDAANDLVAQDLHRFFLDEVAEHLFNVE